MANMTRWEPLNDLISLRDAMDQLLADSFVRPASGGRADPAAGLALDLYETDKDVVVKTNAPGVKPEDLNVSITGDILTIQGEVKGEREDKGKNYIRREMRYGSFQRQVALPPDVDTEKCDAKFEHGVLTLTFPKMAKAQAKKIQVGTGQEQGRIAPE